MIQRLLILISVFVVGCTKAPSPQVVSSASASPRADEELYRKGTQFLETDPEKAIDYFTKSLDISPNSPPAIYNRAVAYARVGRDNDAVADVNRLEKVSPQLGKSLRAQLALSAAPYTDLGNSELKAGNFAKAIVKYESALAYSPGDPDALVGKGLALKHLGKFDQALACYDKALEVEPESYSALMNRAALHQEQNCLEKALADCTKAIGLSPDNAEPYSRRSAVYAVLKMPEEAAADKRKSEDLESRRADKANPDPK